MTELGTITKESVISEIESAVSMKEEDDILRKLLDLIHETTENSEIVKNIPQKKSESKVDELVRDSQYELIDRKEQLQLFEAFDTITVGCILRERIQLSKKLGDVKNTQKLKLDNRHGNDFNWIIIINSLLIPLLVCSLYGKDFAGKLEGALTITLLISGSSAYLYRDLRKKQEYNQKFNFLASEIQTKLLKNQ